MLQTVDKRGMTGRVDRENHGQARDNVGTLKWQQDPLVSGSRRALAQSQLKPCGLHRSRWQRAAPLRSQVMLQSVVVSGHSFRLCPSRPRALGCSTAKRDEM